VETPQDAIECFLGTGIDYLAIHDYLVSKNRFHRFLDPVIRTYADVVAIVRTEMRN
ncbi:MAG: carbamoyltransferase, partial [Variibacter sp.]|nr:carbamoyltransferase [Variibacter sp.]